MFIDSGLRAGRQRQSRAPFFDAVFEANEFMLLGVFFYTRREMRRVAVQPIEMRRVDGVFHRLQPVALDDRFLDDPTFAMLPHQNIPARQERHRRRTQIRVNQPAEVLDRISNMFDAVFERAVRRLRRLFETFARAIELPTVVRATNSLVIDAAVGK